MDKTGTGFLSLAEFKAAVMELRLSIAEKEQGSKSDMASGVAAAAGPGEESAGVAPSSGRAVGVGTDNREDAEETRTAVTPAPPPPPPAVVTAPNDERPVAAGVEEDGTTGEEAVVGDGEVTDGSGSTSGEGGAALAIAKEDNGERKDAPIVGEEETTAVAEAERRGQEEAGGGGRAGLNAGAESEVRLRFLFCFFPPPRELAGKTQPPVVTIQAKNESSCMCQKSYEDKNTHHL